MTSVLGGMKRMEFQPSPDELQSAMHSLAVNLLEKSAELRSLRASSEAKFTALEIAFALQAEELSTKDRHNQRLRDENKDRRLRVIACIDAMERVYGIANQLQSGTGI